MAEKHAIKATLKQAKCPATSLKEAFKDLSKAVYDRTLGGHSFIGSPYKTEGGGGSSQGQKATDCFACRSPTKDTNF